MPRCTIVCKSSILAIGYVDVSSRGIVCFSIEHRVVGTAGGYVSDFYHMARWECTTRCGVAWALPPLGFTNHMFAWSKVNEVLAVTMLTSLGPSLCVCIALVPPSVLEAA